MCGIFGVVPRDPGQLPDAKALEHSLALLGHRGPDGSGQHAELGLGLAHSRLSLLDPSERGAQPLWDESRRYCLVYNGEIYNHRALRREGARFRSSSDTETLLQLLIHEGARAALPRLEGMFAFAFYDRRERSLLLARDRLGIKPLLVYEDEQQLLFSSEVRAMQPWISLEANPQAISSYLLSAGRSDREQSFFEGVRMLAPGGMATIELGRPARYELHARLSDLVDPQLADSLASERPRVWVDRVEAQLDSAVESMLIADAPVGALCSGGVDSSLVMALARRRHRDLRIFHADVVGPASERDAAEALARHLGLELESVSVEDGDFVALLPTVTKHYEKPFTYHPNSVPFLQVSRLVAASGVKAVLSGEGSDECFLGYDFVAQEPLVRFSERQLAWMERLARALPAIGHALPARSSSTSRVMAGMLGHFDAELERQQLDLDFEAATGRAPDRNVRSLHLLSRHLRTLLHRNDRLGMAAGIEARFPYLDEALLRSAVNLPLAAKLRRSASWHPVHPFLTDKWVLREVARRHLPRFLSHRRKLGFPAGAYERLRVSPTLFHESFVADHFRLSAAQTECLLEAAEPALRIALLHLEVWAAVCLRREDPERLRSRLAGALHFEATPKGAA